MDDFSPINRSIAVLSPHMAHLDPRVKWIVDSLEKKYQVISISNYPVEHASLLESEPFYKKYETINVKNARYTTEFHFLNTVLGAMFWPGVSHLLFIVLIAVFGLLDLIYGFCKLILNIVKSLLQPFYTTKVLTSLLKRIFRPKLYYGLTYGKFMWFYFGYIFITFSSLYHGVKISGQKFSLFYCNDLPSLLVGIYYKKKFGARVVYDAHEIFWDSVNESPGAFKFFFKHYELLLLRNVDSFITVSPQIEKLYLSKCRSLERKSFTIPNACPSDTSSSVSVPATSGKIRFLFQGAFAPGRGLEDVIKAWVTLNPKHATLTLRGPDTGGIREKTAAMALPLIEKSIFFVPSVTEDELINAARGYDVGLIPYPSHSSLNQKYCSPNKLGQYMQAGLAILAADTEFVKSVINENKCGLLYQSGKPESIASAIENLIGARPLLTQLKENSRRAGIENFNWERYENTLYTAVEKTPK